MTAPPRRAHEPIDWPDPARRAAFEAWLARVAAAHGLDAGTLRPASADASFRRYFRLDGTRGSRVVMDAPPAQEDCRPFVTLAAQLAAAGLNVPAVLEWDEAQGFLLLTDLGQSTYFAHLAHAPHDAEALYADANAALVRLQGIAAQGLVPPYDRAFLQRELDIFPEWYVARHRAATLADAERADLQRVFALLIDRALAQPQVLVHRDWHSRNLMVCAPFTGHAVGPAPNPGILDFQGALFGPITYDLASLLRDAYVDWDEAVQLDRAVRYWERARNAGLPVTDDFGEFWRDFEWMGLQRHLKVLGIFARLAHRDGKPAYLNDMPRVWRHAHHVAMRYREFARLARLLERLEGERRAEGYTF